MSLTDRQLQSLRNLGNEFEEAADEIARLRDALRTTLVLKNLGGMLPGTHQIVQMVVAEAEEALGAVKEQASPDRG